MDQGKSSSRDWEQYYQLVAGRSPRLLLIRALDAFAAGGGEPAGRFAIDLGCGDGIDSLALINAGWKVLAIDREPAAIRLLEQTIPPEKRALLEVQRASFEHALLPPADLIFAAVSLPFCPPQHFDAVWQNVRAALRPGGRLAVHLFGDRDDWTVYPDMTFFTVDAARALFDGLDVEFFEEEERDGPSGEGPKHWHIFEVIARRAGQ